MAARTTSKSAGQNENHVKATHLRRQRGRDAIATKVQTCLPGGEEAENRYLEGMALISYARGSPCSLYARNISLLHGGPGAADTSSTNV